MIGNIASGAMAKAREALSSSVMVIKFACYSWSSGSISVSIGVSWCCLCRYI